MKKGRSTYNFQINCDPNAVNNLIQAYIQGNKYELQSKNGEQYYRAGNAMVEGYRYFNYSIIGQTLTIYAWFKGVLGEIPIEQNSLNMPAMNYRNSLGRLFQELEILNNGGNNMNNNGNNFNSQTGQPIQQNNQFTQTFQEETTKKQEKMCEVGFWLSIFGLVASFFGIAYGVIVYILNFYFASQGLKTRKKGKAIATIVMSIVSIIIIVIKLINL